ncbi:MAG: hypothetical protein E7267_04650 [Lachnospiraceae bacterium]|nr:hypothetical protein [Lachnospiraceae bacterium]
MEYSENDIRELLLAYVNTEMNSIILEEMPGYDHVYSRRYKKRLKKMLWSEKYFGPRLMLGYVVRYVAIFAAIIFSLYAANEVSAKVFGINPWKTIVSFFADSEVNHKTYTELTTTEHMEPKTIVRDVPLNVPEGFEVVVNRENVRRLVVWNNKNVKEEITYIRTVIGHNAAVLEDATYERIADIMIAGYKGYCYTDPIHTWVEWEDVSYKHVIEVTNDSYIDDVISMANSLYE